MVVAAATGCTGNNNGQREPHGGPIPPAVLDYVGLSETTGDRMAARRKSGQRRDDPCAGGLRKRVQGESIPSRQIFNHIGLEMCNGERSGLFDYSEGWLVQRIFRRSAIWLLGLLQPRCSSERYQ